ncbi:MAG: PilZ domain-containing protein, partial [Pseudomonadales bacterium]
LEDYQRRDIDYELEGIASEIERIDQKMNLITELLCDLLSAEAQIPAPRVLAISMAGLQLRPSPGDAYHEGDWVILNLFLIQGVPRPLKLLATVVPTSAAANLSGDAGGGLTFSFVDLSDGVSSMLGRLVFRHHRREVALTRAQSGAVEGAS